MLLRARAAAVGAPTPPCDSQTSAPVSQHVTHLPRITHLPLPSNSAASEHKHRVRRISFHRPRIRRINTSTAGTRLGNSQTAQHTMSTVSKPPPVQSARGLWNGACRGRG